MDLPRLLAVLGALLSLLLPPVVLTSQNAAAAEPDVTVTEADDGRVVHLAVGQRLQVRLTPAEGEVWNVAVASGMSALFLEQLWADAASTTATYQARKATEQPEELTGTTDRLCRHQQPACELANRSWHVQVLVDAPGQLQAPPCQQVPQPSPGPGTTYLEGTDNGRTVNVRQGEVVVVSLGCQWLVPDGGGPLFRERAAKGWASFRAAAVGSTTIEDVSDEVCFHDSQPCARPSAVWRVTVQVFAADGPCVGGDLTAPTAVPIGAAVTVRGNATAGSRVEVWFRRRGETAFTLRRVLTADANGLFATSYVATDDQRYYARVASCQSALELTVVNPVISGPASVVKGSTVTLLTRGIPHAPVRIAFLREAPGATYDYRRYGRFSDRGTYTTTYVATATYRYFALQGDSGQRASAERRTIAR